MLLRINRLLTSCSYLRMTTVITTINPERKCFSIGTARADNALKFNEQQITQILNLINTKSGELLASYDISKTKLNKLEAWKQKNGKFQNLEDILYLDGFSVKIVEKFCKSLLGEERVKRLPRKVTSFVTPSMPETQINEINSSVSVSVGVTSISWCRLELTKDGPCQLTDWQRHDIQEKKLHLNDLINRCLYVDYLIPQADCYLFENPQVAQGTTPGNAEQVNINVQRAQLTAILGFSLANRNKSTEKSKPNVFYLRRFLSARLFQHLIGTESVSTEKTILGLMRTHYNVEDLPDTDDDIHLTAQCSSSRGMVNFPMEMRNMFNEAERFHRDFLGKTLLLNLAFVRLVLLRDAKARAIVTRTSKADVVQ